MLQKYAKLVVTAVIGSALIGCSATPEVQDNYQYSEPKSDSASSASQGSVTQKSSTASSDLDVAKQDAEMTTEQLKAMIRGKVIYFEYDRSDIRSQYYEIIKLNAEYMSRKPDAKLTIAGHCDERGSREYNLALGERRALSVKNALMAEGISPRRINVLSFGEDMPVVEGHNESAWSKNRRAEFNY